MESEVKRLHNLIIDFNNRKLKTQQDKVDKINQEIDECTSAITKAQVAIKTAQRYSTSVCDILKAVSISSCTHLYLGDLSGWRCAFPSLQLEEN